MLRRPASKCTSRANPSTRGAALTGCQRTWRLSLFWRSLRLPRQTRPPCEVTCDFSGLCLFAPLAAGTLCFSIGSSSAAPSAGGAAASVTPASAAPSAAAPSPLRPEPPTRRPPTGAQNWLMSRPNGRPGPLQRLSQTWPGARLNCQGRAAASPCSRRPRWSPSSRSAPRRAAIVRPRRAAIHALRRCSAPASSDCYERVDRDCVWRSGRAPRPRQRSCRDSRRRSGLEF
jgi:hypothetical protein